MHQSASQNGDIRLFEAHLPVRDLARSMPFYEEVLELGYRDDARRIAFYWIGGHGTNMLGLWEKPEPEIHREHIAFSIPLERMDPAIGQLAGSGVNTRDFFGEESTTPTVLAWMPAVSIYFDDPDGHLLEYIAMMPGAPRPELGQIPWEDRFAENGLDTLMP